MRFIFAGDEEDAAVLGVSAYRLQLVDATGQSVMALRLPSDLIEPVVVTELDCVISMAPDGIIAVTIVGRNIDGSHHDVGSIETLVANAVHPSTLEDEPDAPRMLRMLRDRLQRALQAVDAAIAGVVDET